MKKGKTIMIILIIILSLALVGYGSYRLLDSEKKEEKKSEEKQSEKKEEKQKEKVIEKEVQLTQENVTVEKDSSKEKQFTTLDEYGNKIYEEKSYQTYPKKNGAFFISLNQLKKDFGYDVSMFIGEDGTVCDKDLSGIYFDEEGTLGITYQEGANPISPILVGCSKEELDSNEKNESNT